MAQNSFQTDLDAMSPFTLDKRMSISFILNDPSSPAESTSNCLTLPQLVPVTSTHHCTSNRVLDIYQDKALHPTVSDMAQNSFKMEVNEMSSSTDIDVPKCPRIDMDSTPDLSTSLAPTLTQMDANAASSNTTQSPPANSSSRSHSSLHKLPSEVLGMISRHELQSSQGVPNLLPTLAADKNPSTGARTDLYYIVQYNYRNCNLKASSQNFGTIKQRSLKDLLRYSHIEIIGPVNFQANKLTLKNNFETIAFDLSKAELATKTWWSVGTQASWLIAASSCARQLVVKDKIGKSAFAESEKNKNSLSISEALGIKLKWRKMPKEGIQCWIWERQDGGKLSWSWRG